MYVTTRNESEEVITINALKNKNVPGFYGICAQTNL